MPGLYCLYSALMEVLILGGRDIEGEGDVQKIYAQHAVTLAGSMPGCHAGTGAGTQIDKRIKPQQQYWRL